jgi:hypothetical protein
MTGDSRVKNAALCSKSILMLFALAVCGKLPNILAVDRTHTCSHARHLQMPPHLGPKHRRTIQGAT